MAAGKGTRMKDPSKAKVMYEILDKPMIHYVVDLAFELRMDRVLVVVGHQRETVSNYLRISHPRVECVVQAEQLGTGHAIVQAKASLREFTGRVLVLSGDVPLLTSSTIHGLMQHHQSTAASATILTAEVPDPTGYGRILRDKDQSVIGIVEHRDAKPDQLRISEINSGIYVFDKSGLFEGLEQIKPDNVQHEYYLTDVFDYFWQHHLKVAALKVQNQDEIRGINNFEQLEEARKLMEARKVVGHERRGTKS